MGKDKVKDESLKKDLKTSFLKSGVGKNKEEIKRKMEKIEAQSNVIAYGSIREDDIVKIVKGQRGALHNAVAGVEITEDIGDFRERVSASIDRMEERLREKLEEEKEKKRKRNAKKDRDVFDDKDEKKRNRRFRRSKLKKKIKEKFSAFKEKVKKKVTQAKNWTKNKFSKLFSKKAEDKVIKEVEEKALKKVGDKAVSKQGTKVATKVATKTGSKVAVKVGTKACFKSVLKKIPVVSAVVGTGLAVERCFKGEWGAAGGELLSGVAGCFPGVGTAASVAIDVGLAANDIAKAKKTVETGEKIIEGVKKEFKEKQELGAIKQNLEKEAEILRAGKEVNKGDKSLADSGNVHKENTLTAINVMAQKGGRG